MKPFHSIPSTWHRINLIYSNRSPFLRPLPLSSPTKSISSTLVEANAIPSSSDVLCKVHNRRPPNGLLSKIVNFRLLGAHGLHTSQHLSNIGQSVVELQKNTENGESVDENGNTKRKRPKLKGKRAVVRWLKFFRWKKKKEYERMTVEEKILYKLRKAQKKEARLVEALKKIEPSNSSETTHDPEILTPEEHFYYLKMGKKCKNYVPVGRRGIFQGVILNMHLHWKKHQTLKVVVKTFTPEEVREIAAELARLSGGIVLDIDEENTIIMYRGKNYSQPPTEIMSPKITLSRRKALDKSKYREGLRSLRMFIPRLEQDLEDLQAQMKGGIETKVKIMKREETQQNEENRLISDCELDNFDGFEERETGKNNISEDDSWMESGALSESEDLSDIFETDSDGETEEKTERPLYLEELERLPSEDDGEPEDFEEHLRKISSASKRGGDSSRKDLELAELDEIDKLFLRAGSLLKIKKEVIISNFEKECILGILDDNLTVTCKILSFFSLYGRHLISFYASHARMNVISLNSKHVILFQP